MNDLTPTGNTVIGYCDGCEKINSELNCTAYNNPTNHCRVGCAFSPKAKENNKSKDSKIRIGQQKQKKGKKKKK